MLRQAFTDRLKQSMKAREARTVSTIRLMLAELKARDIAARGRGNAEGLSDVEIQRMLQAMIKQRRESIALYEQGNREDLAQQEREEIAVIESFLPNQLDQSQIEAAVRSAIGETGAAGVKEMGRVMGVLRERYDGIIDFARAGAIAKRLLG
jgi:uncharacterized protein